MSMPSSCALHVRIFDPSQSAVSIGVSETYWVFKAYFMSYLSSSTAYVSYTRTYQQRLLAEQHRSGRLKINFYSLLLLASRDLEVK
jgi:hypothetical protein